MKLFSHLDYVSLFNRTDDLLKLSKWKSVICETENV